MSALTVALAFGANAISFRTPARGVQSQRHSAPRRFNAFGYNVCRLAGKGAGKILALAASFARHPTSHEST
ncbi:hypothetical protein [Caballeronia sp. AZ10_KS36]|uniref:hypothetical protein n=1 Tax=Caballeronia sp. AZ10_KS36 TaxID=2921757 RepID=UPI0020293701|nr:hypothetical protein [Caballeronia sp. AZ10_KS36]